MIWHTIINTLNRLLRAVTQVLLKHDFGFKEWTIPLNHLCPPLPQVSKSFNRSVSTIFLLIYLLQRLNYIHWIADLLKSPEWIYDGSIRGFDM